MNTYQPQPRDEDHPERIFSANELAEPRRTSLLACAAAVAAILLCVWFLPGADSDARLTWLVLAVSMIVCIGAIVVSLISLSHVKHIRRESHDKHRLRGAYGYAILGACVGLLGIYTTATLMMLALFGGVAATVTAFVLAAVTVFILTNVDY